MGSKKSCELCKQIITMEYDWKPFSQWTKPNFTCVECKDLIVVSTTALLYIITAAMVIFHLCWRMTNTVCGLYELVMWVLGIYFISVAISLIVSWNSYLMWSKIILLMEIV